MAEFVVSKTFSNATVYQEAEKKCALLDDLEGVDNVSMMVDGPSGDEWRDAVVMFSITDENVTVPFLKNLVLDNWTIQVVQ